MSLNPGRVELGVHIYRQYFCLKSYLIQIDKTYMTNLMVPELSLVMRLKMTLIIVGLNEDLSDV